MPRPANLSDRADGRGVPRPYTYSETARFWARWRQVRKSYLRWCFLSRERTNLTCLYPGCHGPTVTANIEFLSHGVVRGCPGQMGSDMSTSLPIHHRSRHRVYEQVFGRLLEQDREINPYDVVDGIDPQ